MSYLGQYIHRRASRLYRGLTRLHNVLPFYFEPMGRAFPPWHYFLEVTRRCNLRCSMCQYREWFARHTPEEIAADELTTEEWKNVINQTGRMALLTFTGGEPWTRPDFAELLTHASANRRTHVISNGLLLNPERIRTCVDLAPKGVFGKGLCSLGFSIDGVGETHDLIRNRAGAFDETCANVRELTARRNEAGKRMPITHITAVIQEANLDVLPEMPAVVAAMGADSLNLTLEIRFFALEGVGEVPPDSLCLRDIETPRINPIRLRKALALTRDAARREGVELRLPAMPMREILRYYSGEMDVSRFVCRAAWTNLTIGAKGDVCPCFIQKIGNVREHALNVLWNGPDMRAFRKRLKSGPFCVCQGCCHLEYTGGK